MKFPIQINLRAATPKPLTKRGTLVSVVVDALLLIMALSFLIVDIHDGAWMWVSLWSVMVIMNLLFFRGDFENYRQVRNPDKPLKD